MTALCIYVRLLRRVHSSRIESYYQRFAHDFSYICIYKVLLLRRGVACEIFSRKVLYYQVEELHTSSYRSPSLQSIGVYAILIFNYCLTSCVAFASNVTLEHYFV